MLVHLEQLALHAFTQVLSPEWLRVIVGLTFTVPQMTEQASDLFSAENQPAQQRRDVDDGSVQEQQVVTGRVMWPLQPRVCYCSKCSCSASIHATFTGLCVLAVQFSKVRQKSHTCFSVGLLTVTSP